MAVIVSMQRQHNEYHHGQRHGSDSDSDNDSNSNTNTNTNSINFCVLAIYRVNLGGLIGLKLL